MKNRSILQSVFFGGYFSRTANIVLLQNKTCVNIGPHAGAMYISKAQVYQSGSLFGLQLVGTADVERARGDSMCAEAIKKLKVD